MKKIAIVNRTNLKNFGSVLQVYALCDAVKRLGYDSEVVWQSGNISGNFDVRPNKIIRILLKLLCHPSLIMSTYKTFCKVKTSVTDAEDVRKFNDFVAGNFVQVFYSPSQIKKIAASGYYSKFVCGSDQVWVTTTLYPDPMMYLRFAPETKRVAYAPSLGRDFIPRYNRKTLKKYINGLPRISVREDQGRRLIKELTGRDAAVVADPTLLMKSSEWDRLWVKVRTPEKYVLCYFLDEPADDVKYAICKSAAGEDMDIVILGRLSGIDYPSGHIYRPSAGPGEFLYITAKSSMVITDSYHGMLFAINYHKKFWSVERAYREFDQSSRQMTVLSRLGLENRYLKTDFDFTGEEIDYTAVQDRIDEFATFSMNYLRTSLEQ